jgi:hypothetical protein
MEKADLVLGKTNIKYSANLR